MQHLPKKFIGKIRRKKPPAGQKTEVAKRGAGGYTEEEEEVAGVSKELWQMLGLYLLAVNGAAFVMMGADKRRASRGRWRIPEKGLFLFPVLGGALGGVLGMKAFRHKIRRRKFRWGFGLLLLLQAAGLVLLAWRQIG